MDGPCAEAPARRGPARASRGSEAATKGDGLWPRARAAAPSQGGPPSAAMERSCRRRLTRGDRSGRWGGAHSVTLVRLVKRVAAQEADDDDASRDSTGIVPGSGGRGRRPFFSSLCC